MLYRVLTVILFACAIALPGLSQGEVTLPSTTDTQPAEMPEAEADKLEIVAQYMGNTGYDTKDVLTEYGCALYANDMRYLRQKFYYEGLSSSKTKTIYIRLIDPTGKIQSNENSPTGYTWVETREFYPGKNWMTTRGWGSADKSNFIPGRYISEIWIDGVCVSAVPFDVY